MLAVGTNSKQLGALLTFEAHLVVIFEQTISTITPPACPYLCQERSLAQRDTPSSYICRMSD